MLLELQNIFNLKNGANLIAKTVENRKGETLDMSGHVANKILVKERIYNVGKIKMRVFNNGTNSKIVTEGEGSKLGDGSTLEVRLRTRRFYQGRTFQLF